MHGNPPTAQPGQASPATHRVGDDHDRAESVGSSQAAPATTPEPARPAHRTPRGTNGSAPRPDRGRAPSALGSPDRFERYGHWVVRRRRRLILAWLVVVVGLSVGFSSHFSENLTAASGTTPGSEAAAVEAVLQDAFGVGDAEQDLIVFESTSLDLDDVEFRRIVEETTVVALTHPAVIDAASPLAATAAGQVSADRRAAYTALTVAGSVTERQVVAEELVELLEGSASGQVDVWLTGESPLVVDVDRVAQDDLARAETIGLPIALLVLLLAFGAVVAAGLPLLLAGVGIATTFGVLGVLSYFTEFNLLTENIATLIGLGVGIDFAMFIVARFRESLAQGHSAESAAVSAISTSGRSVLFSGMTTVIAVSGLFMVNSPIFHDLAVAVMVTVVAMVAAALTLLPAVLSWLGTRVDKGKIRRTQPRAANNADGAWARIARVVMRRPALVTVIIGVALIAVAAPALRLELGMSSGTDAVADHPSGRGLAVLEEHFSQGATSPIDITLTPGGGSVGASLDALLNQLNTDPGIADARPVATSANGTTYIVATSTAAPDSDEATALVERIRNDIAPIHQADGAEVLVGGMTAGIIDQSAEMDAKLPLVISYVLVITFILLMLVFRSPALAVKAIIMNLLSVGAAYGLVVVMFQDGLGESLFGFTSPGYIQSYLPLFAFVILFGISMDYELFLLGRMREEWNRTGDNTEAVTRGMQHTARPITSAAAIQAAVFGAFAFTSVIDIQEIGFALAVAIIIDATIVRALLVPASMKLMGRWNWWTPRWVDRHLPHVALTE
jgi:putative drug exporter of the RND superfamily